MTPPCLVRAALASALFVLSIGGTRAVAQCGQWVPGEGSPGVNGTVWAVVEWDPDGTGPLSPLIVVGGQFTTAGGTPASNIAAFDPSTSTWSALGAGIAGPSNTSVFALTVLASGELVAGGLFTAAGGNPAGNLAAWNGATWSAIGGGTDDSVHSLLVLPNSHLLVGGHFTTAGGASTPGIAVWSGTAWSTLGTGIPGAVNTMARAANGDLIAGGSFSSAGGISALAIARWDGAVWSPMPGLSAEVLTVAITATGEVLAGGDSLWLRRWTGSGWQALSTSIYPRGLTIEPNGDVVAVHVHGAHRLSGTTWTSFAFGASLRAVTRLANGDLLVGGSFTGIEQQVAHGVARWNGAAWSPLAPGFGDAVLAFDVLPNGDVIAGGRFNVVEGNQADHVARWDGSTWSAIGTGVSSIPLALTHDIGGQLFAAGTRPPTSLQNQVHSWNGASWATIAQQVTFVLPFTTDVAALTVMPNGDLVAAGLFTTIAGVAAEGVARWNGAVWTPLLGSLNGRPYATALMANGDLVVAGELAFVNGAPVSGVFRWNGTTAQPLGQGLLGAVRALVRMPNDWIVAAHTFTVAGVVKHQVTRWDGSTWLQLGSGSDGPVTELALMPDGDVIAGGSFTTIGGVAANNIARWDWTAWSALGAGTDGVVEALAVHPSGELLVGGRFQSAGGLPSAFFARYVSTCLPTATPFANGCASSGGANVLTATTLPWVDAPFHVRGSGLPTSALVFVVTGLAGVPAGVVPLASIFAEGVAGCDLLAAPDILQAVTTSNGVADSQLFLPGTPPLIGVAFHQQMIPFELDASLNLVSITATNSLRLVAGDF